MGLVPNTNKNNVSICIPTCGQCEIEFAHSLAVMMCETQHTGVGLRVTTRSGSLIAASRQALAEKSLGFSGCTHLLFLDDDMGFPPDTLTRMLAHDEGIVGVNYLRREEKRSPVACSTDRKLMFLDDESSGLVEASSTGTGIMLIRMEVFRALPKPWFETSYNIQSGHYEGEDRYFCHKAADYGYKTWIDQDLSKEVVHIGSKRYVW